MRVAVGFEQEDKLEAFFGAGGAAGEVFGEAEGAGAVPAHGAEADVFGDAASERWRRFPVEVAERHRGDQLAQLDHSFFVEDNFTRRPSELAGTRHRRSVRHGPLPPRNLAHTAKIRPP